MLTLIWPNFTTSPATMIVRFGRAIHGLALVVALIFLAFSGVYAAVTPACATANRDTSDTMSQTEKTFAEFDRARMASEDRWRKYRAEISAHDAAMAKPARDSVPVVEPWEMDWDNMKPVAEKRAANPFDKYDAPDRRRATAPSEQLRTPARSRQANNPDWDSMTPVAGKPAPNYFDKYVTPQSVKPTDGCPGRANYLQSILLIITCALGTAAIGRGARYVLSGE